MKLIRCLLFGIASIGLLHAHGAQEAVAEHNNDAFALVAVDPVKQRKSTKRAQPTLPKEGEAAAVAVYEGNAGQFEEEFHGIKQELEKLNRIKQLHLQAQEVKQLRESLEQLRGETDSTKRDAILKKVTKIVGGSIDQVGAILGIAVPVCTILLVFSLYRGMRNFFGLDTTMFVGKQPQGSVSNQAYRCASWWSWMTDSTC